MNVTPVIQKVIVIILVLCGIGYVAYGTLFGEVKLPVDANGEVIVDTVGIEILTLSQKLESAKIDKTLFTSDLFTSLTDITSPLSAEEKGRVNPFASIGSEGVSGTLVTTKRIP